MYVIKLNNDHSLIATNRIRIMQRSKLIDTLCFLVPPTYDNFDMTKTTVCMEYITPISREYKTKLLTCEELLYKEHLQYIIPFDTDLTREHGNLEIQLSFVGVSMDDNGKIKQHSRKTEVAYITITPIAAWSDMIPDEQLTVIDQRLIKTEAMIQQMFDINMSLADEMPNTLLIEDGKLHIGRDGERLVDSRGVDVVLPRVNDGLIDGKDDGILEIDDSAPEDKPHEDNCNCGCDHEFVELDNLETDDIPTIEEENGFIEV